MTRLSGRAGTRKKTLVAQVQGFGAASKLSSDGRQRAAKDEWRESAGRENSGWAVPTRRRVAEGRGDVNRNILVESYSNTRVRRGAVVQGDKTDAQENPESKPEGPTFRCAKDGAPSRKIKIPTRKTGEWGTLAENPPQFIVRATRRVVSDEERRKEKERVG